MYYQVEQVLEKQEPEIEKFYKGRGILICESKQNLFALKEYSASLQKAEFLYWLGICGMMTKKFWFACNKTKGCRII